MPLPYPRKGKPKGGAPGRGVSRVKFTPNLWQRWLEEHNERQSQAATKVKLQDPKK